MDSRKKISGKYIFIWFISLVLLCIAIMGPQMLFYVQDNYQISKSWQGKHLSLSVDALNNSYRSLRDRMAELAEGLAQSTKYYVTGTDYKMNDDFFVVLEKVLGEEQAVFFEQWGLEPYILLDDLQKIGYDAIEWKKYVIYDDFMEDGATSVVATAWYIELLTADDCRIKILADTESNTIYYFQFEHAISELEKKESYSANETLIVTDSAVIIAEKSFELFMMWSQYYEADEADYEEALKAIIESATLGNELYITYNLNYDNNYLQWEMGGMEDGSATYGNNLFYMGIKEFGQLIPEFAINT